ncbi:hypothetical protein PTTG_02589 [Puccinia triticina 1-1 BBBD Race 1]|uniref:Uncharacterized protein n=1 Tax=Puccinia triticina (isolate 1-1 / race 1 (BBBD)) TaxID=630390 RepID=A0A0C4EP88_PUCT1|nr:hypothetical protein PTTG_02589 [Puccinia triticina 1-1 BBBD Race 1]
MSASNQAPTPKQFVMVQSLTGIKHLLYCIVALFSFILFIVSCVVVPYERDTYGGYNPPAAELAFTAAVGAFFTPVFVWAQRVRPDFIFNSLAAELAYCTFMWSKPVHLSRLQHDDGLCVAQLDHLHPHHRLPARHPRKALVQAVAHQVDRPTKVVYLASRGELELFSDPSIPEKQTTSASLEA